MKPARFEYRAERSLPQLLDDLAEYGADAAILAGGQSLASAMNLRLARPKLLLDINPVAELTEIALSDGRLAVGAGVRQRTLETSELVARRAPLIAAAAPLVGTPIVRNRGTVGGSVAVASPTAELPACFLCPGARIVLRSKRERRSLAADDFFLGPRRTAARPDEAVTEIEIPTADDDARFAIREVSLRQTGTALAGVAIRARLRGGRLRDVRAAFFGVAGRATLSPSLAAVAEQGDGPPPVAEIRAAIARDVEVVGDSGHPAAVRLHLASVLAARILNGMRHDDPSA